MGSKKTQQAARKARGDQLAEAYAREKAEAADAQQREALPRFFQGACVQLEMAERLAKETAALLASKDCTPEIRAAVEPIIPDVAQAVFANRAQVVAIGLSMFGIGTDKDSPPSADSGDPLANESEVSAQRTDESEGQPDDRS